MNITSVLYLFESLYFRAMLLILCGETKNRFLRRYGIKIGKGCDICSTDFSTEPFLIEIGDNVGIAPGSVFITHDGAVRVLRDSFPEMDFFGKITIGNNTFIGSNCILLPNTKIGSNCIIGAGSVVRGIIPNNTVAFGNPAKVVMRTPMVKRMYQLHRNCIKTKHLSRKKKMDKVRMHFNIKNN